jgi:hypothetical protein
VPKFLTNEINEPNPDGEFSQSSSLSPLIREAFDARVRALMRLRERSRLEVERAAVDNLVVERMNATHPNTDPNCCAHCGGPEMSAATLKPIGWGIRHTWLHDDCWAPWREARRVAAVAKMATIRIVMP